MSLTEEDIKNRYITPALNKAGWENTCMRMEYYFTDGRIIIDGLKGKRAKGKKADYLLYYKDINTYNPIAIVEAKNNNHIASGGLQQAIEYGKILNIPFIYSSNGKSFVEYDMEEGKEKEFPMDEFPSPQQLWDRYKKHENITDSADKVLSESYFYKQGLNTPRYYQSIAVNKTVQAIANGSKKNLLVMATGTGKTFTAFHIIKKLRDCKIINKVLYLADRNILIDQTIKQDFKPFDNIMTQVKNKKLDSSYEIFMALYHQLAGEEGIEPFRQFKPEFFDLIIVDECHRGSAKENSLWRRILDYFSSAIKLGMTATPRQDADVDTFKYFGKPLYSYSLKDGIEDGFLAPYKVIRPFLNVDSGWRPDKRLLDENGEDLEDREYNAIDYDKNIKLQDRTRQVAERITKWLQDNGRMSKVIVFCVGQNHADTMRMELGNLNSDMKQKDERYVMRITGDDTVGKKQLDYFIDETSAYPVIATTSRLLSTGVDCKTVKLIVLDNNINSITEFKQIIGRGTRLKTDYDKWYFTIMDFRGNSRLFADEEFDGIPDEEIDETPCNVCGEFPCVCENTLKESTQNTNNVCDICEQTPCVCEQQPNKTIPVIGLGNVNVEIMGEQVRILDSHGKLITESLTDYSKKQITTICPNSEQFKQIWTNQLTRKEMLNKLDDYCISLKDLKTISSKEDWDDFDLLCHIAYDKKPLTRKERAENVKKRNYLNKYEGLAKEVISILLDKYEHSNIDAIEDLNILNVEPLQRIRRKDIFKAFGGKEKFTKAIEELKTEIFAA